MGGGRKGGKWSMLKAGPGDMVDEQCIWEEGADTQCRKRRGDLLRWCRPAHLFSPSDPLRVSLPPIGCPLQNAARSDRIHKTKMAGFHILFSSLLNLPSDDCSSTYHHSTTRHAQPPCIYEAIGQTTPACAFPTIINVRSNTKCTVDTPERMPHTVTHANRLRKCDGGIASTSSPHH